MYLIAPGILIPISPVDLNIPIDDLSLCISPLYAI